MRDHATFTHPAKMSLPVCAELCGDDHNHRAAGGELVANECDRDVCLAETDAVGEDGAAASFDDCTQPVVRAGLERLETGRCGGSFVREAGSEHAQGDCAAMFMSH
jgi:hypothetical protein